MRMTDWPTLRAAFEFESASEIPVVKRVFAVDTIILPVEDFETALNCLIGEALFLFDAEHVDT